MKHVKLLGLATAVAVILTASAGAETASATTLTCTDPPGTKTKCGPSLPIRMLKEPERYVLHAASGNIECGQYSAEGTITNSGSSTETAAVSMSGVSFSECNATMTVLGKGSLEIHWAGENNGSITSSGMELTVEFLGTHCIFSTNNTSIGTITGSSKTKGKPTIDTTGTLPRSGGRSGAFCGSTATITETDVIEEPAWMDVDP